jgi:iron complex transport system permease protein
MSRQVTVVQRSGRVRFRARPLLLGVLVCGLLVVVCVAVSLGPVRVPLPHTVAILASHLGLDLGSYPLDQALVVDRIRLPRVLTALFVGMGLGVAGAVMQALFRNALAEPGVTGVSSGAAVGAVLALVTGAAGWVLPVAAFGGAVLTLALVYAIAAFGGARSMGTLLLTGIALNALLGAMVSALVANAPDEQAVRGIVFWLQGDLEARTWSHVLMAAPVVVVTALLCLFGRDLNALLLGEDQARASGVAVGPLRHLLLVLAALLTGAAVAVSGVIGFVGLVVPHLVRLVAGPDHRVLLPASALLGAGFLVLADLGARLLFTPVVLQTGVVTALLGAPVFLLLVLRKAATR